MAEAVDQLVSDDVQRELIAQHCCNYMRLYYNNEITLAQYRTTFDRLAHARRQAVAA
jgi:hypothetical protein